VKRLMAFSGQELTVDLDAQTVSAPDGSSVRFEFDQAARHRLLNGLDDIGLTLAHEDEIAAYEAAHASA
jgi:3-isopropylmalate/(R)-2-methylmalate dehydratase small subunit